MVDVRIKASYRFTKSGGLILHMVEQRNTLFIGYNVKPLQATNYK